MKCLCKGSALLLSLIVLANVALLSLILWRSAIFSYDTVLAQKQSSQRSYYLEGLQEYIHWLIRRYTKKVQSKLLQDSFMTIHFPEWPIVGSAYSATITITKREGPSKMAAEGMLYKDHRKCGSVQWIIDKQGDVLTSYDARYS